MKPAAHPRSFSAARRWGIMFSVVVSMAAVAALVVMANYLGARHFERYYLSARAGQKLSPLTTGLLRSITNDVKVVLYFQKSDALYNDIDDLLKEYEVENPRISVQTVDYVTDATGAEKIKLAYKLGDKKDRVILTAGAKPPVVLPGDLFARSKITLSGDATADASGKQKFDRHYTQFNGESLLDGALLALISDRRLQAGYVQDHGEKPLDGQDDFDFAEFDDVLAGCNLQTVYLKLTGTNPIPAECNLLIIAGPEKALGAEEVAKVRAYLAGGGKLLVLFNCLQRGRTGLEPLLADWGVVVGDDIVTDPDKEIVPPAGHEDALPIIAVDEFNTRSDLIRPLANTRLLMYAPRSVAAKPVSGDNAPTVQELARTGPRGVIHYNSTGAAVPGGNVPLMVSVEKKNIHAGIENGVTRIVVAGDSLFLGNTPMNSDENANMDFARLAVTWLVGQTTMMQNVGPRPMVEYKLSMTRAQMNSVRWIFMGAMPGGILALGGLVWLRRRR